MPPPWPPDQALIEGFQNGDLKCFDAIVRRYQGPVVNFFFRLCFDSQKAEDLAQDVFLRLYKHLRTFEPRSRFSSFLFRIARNLWIDHLRRTHTGNRATVSMDAPWNTGEAEASFLKDTIPASAGGASDPLLRSEMQEALHAALLQLPTEHRMVVILSEIHGMKYDEISEVMEIPVGTVKSRMHHAMERLKELLRSVYP